MLRRVQTHFDAIGGQSKIDELVTRFYDLMESLPEAAAIRALHEDMPRAREKLRLFLTGWMGGPQLYVEKYGHPRLRARHLPFPIGPSERDQWMLCMTRALEDVIPDEAPRQALLRAFGPLATHMINRTP
jgi:hemoglobin